MPNNPLKLSKLELRTLALVQALARRDESSWADNNMEGNQRVNISYYPEKDILFFGNTPVPKKEAAGLFKESVWLQLERHGLVKPLGLDSVMITPAGLAYEANQELLPA